MKKQRFFRSIALCVVMLMLLSSIVRAQERKIVEQVVFDFKCEKLGDLQEVSFEEAEKITIHRDFAPHEAFITPEWKKGRDEQYPVGYKAGSSAQVTAIFEICEDVIKNPDATVFAKGLVGGIEVFSTKALGNRTFTTATYEMGMATTPFTAGMVDFFDPYKIEWYISRDQSNWELAGTSMNRLYVPLSKVPDACAIDDTKVYYSIIHYACQPAAGKTTHSDIFSGIWSKFETKSLPRIDRPSKDVNGAPKPMQYWGVENPLIKNTDCRRTNGFLHYEAANCEEWAVFMRYCLGMHAIKDGCNGDIDVKPSDAVTPIAKKAFIAAFGTTPLVFQELIN